MGQFDSSRSRVAPVFDRLQAIDPSGRSWLPTLLTLPTRHLRTNAVSAAPLKERCWWPAERRLPAPKMLLRWLVENTLPPQTEAAWGSEETKTKRLRLTKHEPDVVKNAVTLLEGDVAPSDRAWYVLEGPSCPDVFLLSDDLVVVIEGKRTEAAPTTRTSWMPVRHQMLRHLDAAWEIRGDRMRVGFFIVEGAVGDGRPVPAHWIEAAKQTIEAEALTKSLPHRSNDIQRQIANAFIGVTTWQAVCSTLSIPEAVLIHSVV